MYGCSNLGVLKKYENIKFVGSQNGGIQHYVGKQNLWVLTFVGIQMYWYSNSWVFKDLMDN